VSLSKSEIKFLKSLQQKKFRDSEGLFVVEGVKMLSELTQTDHFEIKGIYHLSDYIPEVPAHLPQIEVNPSELARISGMKTPNMVLTIAKKRAGMTLNTAEENLVLLLDDIKDPGNLGTIIRTADWFGVKQIVCSSETVEMYNPKVIQASMGAIFRMNLMYSSLQENLKSLKESGFKLFGANMNGSNAFETEFPTKSAIVMGSESHGISKALQTQLETITIPKKGDSESLNVGIAAGILIGQYVQDN
jgi:RNA methyltransferase, TrmH family